MAIDQSALERSLVLRAAEFGLNKIRLLFPYERLILILPEDKRTSGGEVYVLAHIAAFGMFFAASPFGAPAWIFYLFTALGIYRLVDIYSFQLRVVLVEVWQEVYQGIESARRSIILTLTNFVELMIIFAIIFRTVERAVDAAAFEPVLGGKSEAIALAVSTATAAGFSAASPVVVVSRAAMIMEVLLAVLLLLIVLALFLQAWPRIPGPRTE